MNEIQTIRARTSDRALGQVTRLFNASLSDILNELLQNARRAEATEVKIELHCNDAEQSFLTVADNGNGIEDPSVLLALGDSQWQEDTDHREAPAGMGVFSLASRGAEIRSRHWCVALQPEHFSGQAAASVRASKPLAGTQVTLPLNESEVERLETLVKGATGYYPLPVKFNGQPLARQDFLHGHLFVQEWLGLRIAVFPSHDARRKGINFYGIFVWHVFPSVSQTRHFSDLTVKVDVVDCPQLKLVLPARKEVVQDEFLEALHEEALRVIYRYLGTLDGHSLSYSRWQRASALGVVLPEAQAQLSAFEPEAANHYEYGGWEESLEISDDALLIDLKDKDASDQQIFWHGFSAAKLSYTALTAEPNYKGYRWYDRLPVLVDFEVEIEVDGKTLSGTQFEQQYASETSVFVDAIAIRACIQNPDGSCQAVCFPSEIYLPGGADWYDIEDVPICLRSQHSFDPEDLAELLEAAYFYPCDDSDSDAYDTQKSYFQERALGRAVEALLSKEEALQVQIEAILERERVDWLVPEGFGVEISLSRKQVRVRVEKER